ncbi:hypothetical protein RchiOBHm_Chr5g0041391 [Rosa chinensis]|uniref:Uncharacterized protein n=1 Tax=Rosa chinensis TaxID=74649 RepID=A0A2P6QCS0_ROSCH|nr:hypothetical protein RchiOBHm_Chr5g0041391 [Rosa chinensis]
MEMIQTPHHGHANEKGSQNVQQDGNANDKHRMQLLSNVAIQMDIVMKMFMMRCIIRFCLNNHLWKHLLFHHNHFHHL